MSLQIYTRSDWPDGWYEQDKWERRDSWYEQDKWERRDGWYEQDKWERRDGWYEQDKWKRRDKGDNDGERSDWCWSNNGWKMCEWMNYKHYVDSSQNLIDIKPNKKKKDFISLPDAMITMLIYGMTLNSFCIDCVFSNKHNPCNKHGHESSKDMTHLYKILTAPNNQDSLRITIGDCCMHNTKRNIRAFWIFFFRNQFEHIPHTNQIYFFSVLIYLLDTYDEEKIKLTKLDDCNTYNNSESTQECCSVTSCIVESDNETNDEEMMTCKQWSSKYQ